MTARRDTGSTLVEILITLPLMGILGALMLSVMSTFLRLEEAPSDRIESTRELARVNETFARDVSSASLYWLVRDAAPADGVVDSVAPTTTVSCPGYTGGGTNLLLLRWSEDFGGLRRSYTAQYLIERNVSSTRVVRVACQSGVIGSSATVVADDLDPAAPAVASVQGQTASITLDPVTGRPVTVSATSLNSGEGIDRVEDDT